MRCDNKPARKRESVRKLGQSSRGCSRLPMHLHTHTHNTLADLAGSYALTHVNMSCGNMSCSLATLAASDLVRSARMHMPVPFSSPCLWRALSSHVFATAVLECFLFRPRFLCSGMLLRSILWFGPLSMPSQTQHVHISACNAKLKHAQRNESTGSPSRRLCRGQEELGRCPCMTMACSRKHLRKADTSRSPPFSPVNTPNSIKAATRCHERFAFRRNGFAEQTCKLWIYAHLCRWHSILFQTCHCPELCHRRWVSAVCRAGSQWDGRMVLQACDFGFAVLPEVDCWGPLGASQGLAVQQRLCWPVWPCNELLLGPIQIVLATPPERASAWQRKFPEGMHEHPVSPSFASSNGSFPCTVTQTRSQDTCRRFQPKSRQTTACSGPKNQYCTGIAFVRPLAWLSGSIVSGGILLPFCFSTRAIWRRDAKLHQRAVRWGEACACRSLFLADRSCSPFCCSSPFSHLQWTGMTNIVAAPCMMHAACGHSQHMASNFWRLPSLPSQCHRQNPCAAARLATGGQRRNISVLTEQRLWRNAGHFRRLQCSVALAGTAHVSKCALLLFWFGSAQHGWNQAFRWTPRMTGLLWCTGSQQSVARRPPLTWQLCFARLCLWESCPTMSTRRKPG